jgi:GTPase
MTICMDRVYEELAKYGTDPIVVRTESDVVLFSRKFVDEKVITPVFEVSCVTGEGLDLLKGFLNNLPNESGWESMAKCSTEFYIDKTYRIEGVGTVVGGIMTKGIVNVPEKLFLGPDAQGGFTQVSVLSIHCKRVPVRSVKAGHICSFHISPDQLPEKIRVGMVLIDVHTTPVACQEFACEVWPVDGGEIRKIRLSYQPVVHCQTVRQSASIVVEGEEVKGEEIPGLEIATGNRTVLRLRFLHRPEYLSVGNVLMIRDTFMTAMGEVTHVFPLSDIR